MIPADKTNKILEKIILKDCNKECKETRETGIWKTAATYALSAMIGFSAITGDFNNKGFSLESRSAHAGEVIQQKSECLRFVTYYNSLQKAGINWQKSGLDLVVIADNNKTEINKIRQAGVKVYMYFPFGSSYAKTPDKNQWEKDVKNFIGSHLHVDGFFWDELSPSYFGYSKLPDFNKRLTSINAHTHANNQKTIANGAMYYADHCDSDYYMWESFMSTFEGSEMHPRYKYVDFFQETWGNDPYDFKNGIEIWRYLKNRGVLGKTLAHSYGDPKDDEKSIYNRIAARILGVGGFSYVDANNFAIDKLIISKGMKMNLGKSKSTQINKYNQSLKGKFEKGKADCMVRKTLNSNIASYSIY